MAVLKLGNLLLAGVLASSATVSNMASANGIAKWIDSDGSVHYGDQPPPSVDATPLTVRPNVIDTGVEDAPSVRSQLARSQLVRSQPVRSQRSFALQRGARQDAKALPEHAELRAYVEHCRRNRGVDCEWEAHAMIDGPATLLFPGDPYIFSRPDVKPPPPGLPLKFQIPPTP